MRNTQCIQNVSLGYLCYSHEVEKTERLRYSKVKISIRKRPHVTRNCVLHKVVDFLFFLGFSQDITFYPFEDMWGYPEIFLLLEFYCSHRLRCDIHKHAADALYLACNAGGDFV